MTVDYPNNYIVGVSISCNIHFENKDILKDELYLNNFMIYLTRKLNLTPLEDTLTSRIFKAEAPVGEGISGMMMLMTSHIFYHTWGKEGFLRLEISICKNINAAEVVAFIYEYFRKENLKFISHEIREW